MDEVAFTVDDADEFFKDTPAETPAGPPDLEKMDLTGAPDLGAPNVAALAEQARKLQEALRISEAGRMAAMNQAQLQQMQAQQVPQQPQTQGPNAEQIREMMASGDPDLQLRAVAAMQHAQLQQVESYYRQRVDSLLTGSMSMAEQEARRQYPLEFEMFGDEILQRARALPDQSPLTSTGGWKQIISYVRGQDENFDRFSRKRAERQAYERQAGNAGFSGTAAARSVAAASPIVVDEVTRKIAEALGEDPVTYARLVQQWDRSEGPMTIT